MVVFGKLDHELLGAIRFMAEGSQIPRLTEVSDKLFAKGTAVKPGESLDDFRGRVFAVWGAQNVAECSVDTSPPDDPRVTNLEPKVTYRSENGYMPERD